MYYIIRLIVLTIIIVSFVLFRALKWKPFYKYSKKSFIIRLIAIVLLVIIIFIPYESSFITFSSAEASVRYSTLNFYAPIKTIETDKTAFCIGHHGNSFYFNTVTKYDDRYGFCDRHCQTVLSLYHIVVTEDSFHGSLDVTKLIDFDTGEKCFIISSINLYDYIDNYAKDTGIDLKDYNVYDEQNNPLNKINFQDGCAVFTKVMDDLNKKSIIKFFGKIYELN